MTERTPEPGIPAVDQKPPEKPFPDDALVAPEAKALREALSRLEPGTDAEREAVEAAAAAMYADWRGGGRRPGAKRLASRLRAMEPADGVDPAGLAARCAAMRPDPFATDALGRRRRLAAAVAAVAACALVAVAAIAAVQGMATQPAEPAARAAEEGDRGARAEEVGGAEGPDEAANSDAEAASPDDAAESDAEAAGGAAAGPEAGGDGEGGAAQASVRPAPSGTSASGSGTPAPSGGAGGGAAAPSKPAHSHSFDIPVTEQRWAPDEVWVQDSAAWTEEITKRATVCDDCGALNQPVEHYKQHKLSGGTGGRHSEMVVVDTIHHEATGHYEDRGRYETVTVGHKCSCGAVQ